MAYCKGRPVDKKRTLKYIDNCQTMTKKDAALKAGFAPSTANCPPIIEGTAGFKELLESYIPKDKLLKKLNEGLDAMAVRVAMKDGVITDEKEYIDYETRHKYMDTGFKLHGSYQADGGIAPQINIQVVASQGTIEVKAG